MSIWISKKEKAYAGSPTANWLKRYVEYLTKGLKETLEQGIADHCDGTAFPHSADAIIFEGSGNVQDAIQKEIADRKDADQALTDTFTAKLQQEAESRLGGDDAILASAKEQVQAETAARKAADENVFASLQSSILKEAQARADRDGNLYATWTSNLANERTERESADKELRKQLTEEQQSRANAIQELSDFLTDKQPADFVIHAQTEKNGDSFSVASTDKTYGEVLAAYNAGKRVYLLWNGRDIIPLSAVDSNSIYFNQPVFGGSKGVQFSISQSGWSVAVPPEYTYLEIEDIVQKGDNAVRTELGNVLNSIVDGKEQPLNLIKTITLTEAVTSIGTTFEKPLKEIYMVFTGTLDGIANEVSDCIIAARCNGGSQYLFYKSSLKFAPDTNKAYIAHTKEVVERRWETVFARTTLAVDESGGLQGLDVNSSDPRMSYSKRRTHLSRYIDHLDFFVYGAKYSFAVGSTLEIYGVEVDE